MQSPMHEVKTNTTATTPLPKKTEKLFTFWSGGWVVLVAVVMSLAVATYILWGAFRGRAIGDGVNVESYRFDLSTLLIPREKVQPALRKDAVKAIVPGQVETMLPADVLAYYQSKHRKLVVDSDRVIGIVINGEARAYPLRVLVQHEVCNDVVGGVPVAVTYSPLCDSAVVFDRRADGGVREFHNSGLLYNSSPLYYDRQWNAKDESLWSQLLFKAVAGPAAGKRAELPRIDHALTTWKTWRDAQPATRVLSGLPQLRENKVYDKDPFNTYFASDEVRFPVDPMWPDVRVPRKTPIAATMENGKWVIRRADGAGDATPGKGVQAFLFAWYAVYPEAAYSGVGK